MTSMRIKKRIVDPITFQEYVGIEFLPRGLEDTIMDDQLGESMCFAAPTRAIRHPPPPPPSRRQSPPPPPPPPDLPDEHPKLGNGNNGTKATDDSIDFRFSLRKTASESNIDTSSLWRPPTPPKVRGKGEDDPNAPRPEMLSPNGLLSPKRVGGRPSLGGGRSNSLRNMHLNSLLSPKKVSAEQRKSIASPGVHRKKLGSFLQEIEEERAETGEDQDANEDSMSNVTDFLQAKKEAEKIVKSVRFEDEIKLFEISKAHLSMMDDLFYASDELANFRYEAFMEEAGLDPSDFD